MTENRLTFILIVVFLVLLFVPILLANRPSGTVTEQSKEETEVTNEQPESIKSPQKKYVAILTTSSGDITIELNSDQTPITVENFVNLSNKGFYDGTIFHRVMKDFMIQGGDPNGDGTGGPGYKFNDEPFEGEYTRGTIAMANSGPNTNGSQFFIMHKDYSLPKNYVIFGKVVEGIEVVDQIAESEVEASSMGELSKPIDPAKIISIQIVEEAPSDESEEE